MRDLGFNLVMVHRETDIVQYLASKLPTIDMPQDYVQQLARDKRITLVTHLVGALRAKTSWEGREVQVVGYLPEAPQSHMKHETPMGYAVSPGTALLGYQLGKGHKPGQAIKLQEKSFRIAEILPEQGTEEDTLIAVNLADAQSLLNKPGKINLILALECRCTENALPQIRKQLGMVLPETQVLRDTSKATARSRQRALVGEKHKSIIERQKALLAERKQALAETATRRERIQGLMETLLGVVTPLVILASALWVGLLMLANVRERRSEIGILRALGKTSASIATLFLGKAVLLGLLGGAIGLALGAAVAAVASAPGPEAAWSSVSLRPEMLLAALLGAPLVAAIASYLPTLAALGQDPATALREQ
jgi:putative ABC transport system permease protein